MDLSQLNELDIRNIASWPLPARVLVIGIIFVGVLGRRFCGSRCGA